jgi:2-amino-4-hydroxy-6-hydroxymethyldihydropteridine diphosphokinase
VELDRVTIFIALGSNLGDRRMNLQEAISQLLPKVVPIACSPVYETEPWGYLDQPYFLNQVVEATTELSPRALLKYLKKIEVRMGRQQTINQGPRLIDLDILFYGNLIIDSPGLSIPHPRMENRAFVLVPLADLALDFSHPILGISVEEMLARIDKKGVKRYDDVGCK